MVSLLLVPDYDCTSVLFSPALECKEYPIDLMQNYCILIRAHLRGWGGGGSQFSKQKMFLGKCSYQCPNIKSTVASQ